MELALELQQLKLQVARNLKDGVSALHPRRKVVVEVKDAQHNLTYDSLDSAFSTLKEDINMDVIEMWLQGPRRSQQDHDDANLSRK